MRRSNQRISKIPLAFFLTTCLMTSIQVQASAVPVQRTTNASWQQIWDRTLAAAKKEGTVVSLTTLGARANESVTKAFKEKFGINVEFISGASSQIFAKVQQERAAGVFVPDLYLSGGASIVLLRDAGYMEPVRPLIILPEALDSNAWYGGKLSYLDKDGVMAVFQMRAIAPFIVNSEVVKPDQIRSYRDLLTPRWKGRMVLYDPTIGSVGAAFLQVLWEIMGPQYVAEFGKQDLILTRDGRQQVEWVAKGKYDVTGTALSSVQAEFTKAGAPLRVVLPAEGTLTTASQGVVGILNRAPHPNAAKIFVNWLLTREAQILMSQATGDPSRRTDVSQEWVDPTVRVPPGSKFASSDTEEMIKKRVELQKVIKNLWDIK